MKSSETRGNSFERKLRRFVGVSIVLATAAHGNVAHADASTSERALAEALFRDARQLADAGKIAPACAKFAESQRLDPKLGTLLYLATCHEKEGKLATAWIEFNEARSLAARAGQNDRERIARARALALEPRLAHLVVTEEEPTPGIEVLLDGKALQAAALGSPLPLDPGEHLIVANAPGRESYELKVTAAKDGEALRVAIPRLKENVDDRGRRDDTPLPAKPVERVDAVDDGGGSQKTIGFVVTGIGVVALAGGAYFGVTALGKKSDADKLCDQKNFCTQQGLDQHEDAKSLAHFSTAGIALGVIGVGVGTYLVLSAKPSSPRPTPSTSALLKSWQVAPTLAPGSAGLAASGRF